MQDKQQLNRQWLLLISLSARRQGVTVREMAAEHQVSHRTIHRDLTFLQSVGFPLKEEAVSGHGRKHWRFTDTQGVPLSFDYEEAVSLYLGRRFLEPLAGTLLWHGAQRAFAKIRASLGEPTLAYLAKLAVLFHHTDGGNSDYTKQAQLIDDLMVGIEDRKITWVTYRSQRATESVTSDLRPYGLIFHRGALYLVAYAPQHDALRHYKVNRIESVDVTGLPFTKPANFDFRAHLAGSFGIFLDEGKSEIGVTVRFLPGAARLVQEARWHPSQKLTLQKDGSLIAEFLLSNTAEIKLWILGFGANAIVLSPPGLRAEILQELRSSLAAYESQPAKTESKTSNPNVNPKNRREKMP